ncbi:hypothetical protein [Microscilla marina]|uniref:Uncharacterized protein n=1 Tax=Microscilla marina ATCC 23134 TaxID=313606 RepID=A1ZMK5_MICM2|nr:hypothetical protein [Microscilla marina]EAY28385.1 hypothetical protein M23134_03937 [Microscilla marina ATCC 23134]
MTTTEIKTTWTARNIWIKKWNKEAVFIEDRLDKYRSMWVPRTAIQNPQFKSKRDFGKDSIHYIYDVEINEEWWKANVRYRGFEFDTNNGHRKSWWS